MYSKELLKGTIEGLILEVLRSQDRMYGYEIAQRIKELSDAKILVSEGSLYPILHRLEKNGVLKAEKESVGNRVRKYYALTQQGKSVAQAASQELADFLHTVQQMLQQLTPKPQTVI